MAFMRCSNCGHRILLPTSITTCPNCGTSIMPFPTPGSSLSAPDPYATSKAPTAALPLSPPVTMSGGGGIGAGKTNATASSAAQQMMNPVLVPSTHVQLKNRARMPRRIPELQGLIIGVQNLQELESSEKPDWGMLLFKQIWDIVWPVYDPRYGGAKEWRTTITSLRVRTADGSQHEARIRGDLRSGSVSLGDSVLLWGKDKRGTLNVRRAYNETSDSEVVLKGNDDNTWSTGLIVVAVTIVIVVILSFIYHIHMFPSIKLK